MHLSEVQLVSAGSSKILQVRVADDPAERAAGYQWICQSDAVDSSVIFIYPSMTFSAFHMRNVLVPLDIYFFDASGAQVDAMVMRPEPPGMPLKPLFYRPGAAFQYALEIARPADYDLQSVLPSLSLKLNSLSLN